MHLLGFLHLIDQLHDVIICVVYGSKRLNIIPKMIEKVEDLFALYPFDPLLTFDEIS